MDRRHRLVLIAFALSGCGSDNPPAQDESIATGAPEQPSSPPVAALPTGTPAPSEQAPPTDANGCSEMQLPGQTAGEGLAKRFVPGPKVKICPPKPVIAAPTAERLPQGPATSNAPGT